MFSSWFRKAEAPAASSAPTKSSAPTPAPASSAAIVPKPRSNSESLSSPPRDIPRRRSPTDSEAPACGSVYDSWAQVPRASELAVPVPPSMTRTSSFSSTDSSASTTSSRSSASSNDHSFSFASQYGGRPTSSFLTDDDLMMDNSDPALEDLNMLMMYNNTGRNTLYVPQRPSRYTPRCGPAKARRTSTRTQMNAIYEE